LLLLEKQVLFPLELGQLVVQRRQLVVLRCQLVVLQRQLVVQRRQLVSQVRLFPVSKSTSITGGDPEGRFNLSSLRFHLSNFRLDLIEFRLHPNSFFLSFQ